MSSPADPLPAFTLLIPARHAASRLPGKPLRLLGGEPLVRHVVRAALAMQAQRVALAVDDARIAAAVADLPVRVLMTRADHASGSDRLAECVEQLALDDAAIVVNLQGDEPFVPSAAVHAVVRALAAGNAPMATLAVPIEDAAQWFDPNVVKVVCDRAGRALYFSRAPLPWARDALAQRRDAVPPGLPLLRHIGLYAYRAGFLRAYTRLSPTPLEQAEALEQLRALEHGHAIAVAVHADAFPPGIDTEDDLARAEAHLAALRAAPAAR